MKLVTYLKQELNNLGDFYAEWKKLSTEDKITLKEWATEEMNQRGIKIIQ